MVCVDSQSVKLAPMIWEERGLDVHKRVNGRKWQLLVDTQGRLWVASVHRAHEPDGRGDIPLIFSLLWRTGERLEKVYGDQAYNGVFAGALSDWSIDRTDFYGSNKGWHIIFVIFFTPANYRTNPVNQLVASRIDDEHLGFAFFNLAGVVIL